jgi:predicted DNA-binding ribbon-helix-helix protein
MDSALNTGPLRANSTLVSRNVTVEGHRTSIRLEPAMWEALREICARERQSLNAIATAVGRGRSASSLTAAIRVHVLRYYQAAATEDGHRRVGHGGATTPPYRTGERAA